MALGDSYASAAELRDHFRIDDADDDVILDRALASASRWVTAHCARDFNQADSATARRFYPRNDGTVDVDDIASTTGLVVATDEGDDGAYEITWTIDTDYMLEPLNGVMDGIPGWPYTRIRRMEVYTWPTGWQYRPPVRVTAIWGWPAVPSPVKEATLIQAARIYKRRDSPDGVLGGLGDFGPVRVGTRIDPDVEALLFPYRKQPVLVA